MIKYCLNCQKQFKSKHRIQKFCTYECYVVFRQHQQPPIFYCCMDCGNPISKPTALKGGGRCRTCSRSGPLSWNHKHSKRGKEHHGWKGGLPLCMDCGKKLSFYSCVRCVKCNAKIKGLFGRKNPMFGKKPTFYLYKYKNCLMRSSWEILVATWFDLSGIKWQYEPKTFDLGNTNYTPDFYLPEFDCYIEVKGWFKKQYKEKYLKASRLINLKVWQKENIKEILGVSNFLLEKSKETWLDRYRIKRKS